MLRSCLKGKQRNRVASTDFFLLHRLGTPALSVYRQCCATRGLLISRRQRQEDYDAVKKDGGCHEAAMARWQDWCRRRRRASTRHEFKWYKTTKMEARRTTEISYSSGNNNSASAAGRDPSSPHQFNRGTATSPASHGKAQHLKRIKAPVRPQQ